MFRSNTSPGNPTRVDVMFRVVREMKLPSSIDHLGIDVIPEGDLSHGDPSTLDGEELATHVIKTGYYKS